MKKREDSSQRHCFNLGIKSIEEMKKKKVSGTIIFYLLTYSTFICKGALTSTFYIL